MACTLFYTFASAMKRSLILIPFLIACACLRAQLQDPVHFRVEQRLAGESRLLVVFTATIDDGWHVYGTDIPSGGPTRAELTVETLEGLELDGELAVKGNLRRGVDDIFGMEVSYLEGTATFTQSFRLTGGAYAVAGRLTYGACSSTNCLPPTDVDFSFSGAGAGEAKAEPEADVAKAVEASAPVATADLPQRQDSAEAMPLPQEEAAEGLQGLWKPVVGELRSFEEAGAGKGGAKAGLLAIFLLGMLGGLAALVTPCVWPIIPMTVSFFLKRAKGKQGRGLRDALTYGLSIVVIYVGLGLIVTLLFGASALNSLSTNAVFNVFFFLLLVLFGASFLGGFDIQLPSRWSDAVDRKAGATTGLLSIFLMAFTLALVSFSCTGPIVGFLLVEVSANGGVVAPTVGMLGFAVALALPFTLFALFPSWLGRVPKSGGWMNCVKVSLGFVELAFSLKFLSVADLAYGWGILDREVFLSLWIELFALWGAYLVGWLRFPHDEEACDAEGNPVAGHRTSVTRFFLSLPCFAFALYMVPGLWGAPCKAVSAFAPPLSTQDYKLGAQEVRASFNDYDEGMAYAKAHGKPALLDFTGYGCVNCRKMEAAVWSDPRVSDIIEGDYVLISLYVDDKTPLPEREVVSDNGQARTLRTVGDKWSYLQRTKFGANAQPFYVIVDNEGLPLNKSYSYDESVPAYVEWLNQGLARYERR